VFTEELLFLTKVWVWVSGKIILFVSDPIFKKFRD